MSALVPLHFEHADVRMIMRDGEPWWVGIDATALLEIRDRHQALARLEDYERGMYNVPTPSGDQEMIVINESGMYSLLLTSRKPIAKTFKRWLTTKVLPSIRRHGSYPPPPAIDAAALPAPEPIQPEIETSPSARFLDECRRIFGTDEARALAKHLEHIVSKARLSVIRSGAGVQKALEHEGAWIALGGFGFDVIYVMTGVRQITRDERELVALLRQLPQQQRALAFHQLTRSATALISG